MKKIDILDLTKIILTFMVVAIHSQLFPMVLYPWLRIAVPLFFIISSYLLYTKISISPKEDKQKIIKHYIHRLLKLYIFWFIVLLPITIYVRRTWFDNGIMIGLIKLITQPFLNSTFVASWYIIATIIGTIIVEYLSTHINNVVLLLLSIFIYIICCFTSSYSFIYKEFEFLEIISKYNIIDPHNSFMVSLIYIYIGKTIVDKKLNIKKNLNIFMIIFSSLLLYIEWFLIYKVSGVFNNDCYFFLLPLAFFGFMFIKNINIKIDNSKLLREFSNFTYPLHASICVILNHVLKNILSINDLLSGVICFIITIIICIISFAIVKKIEKKLKILKYSY